MTSKARTEMARKFLPGSLGTLAWRKVTARCEVQLLGDYSGELVDSPSWGSSLQPASTASHGSEPL